MNFIYIVVVIPMTKITKSMVHKRNKLLFISNYRNLFCDNYNDYDVYNKLVIHCNIVFRNLFSLINKVLDDDESLLTFYFCIINSQINRSKETDKDRCFFDTIKFLIHLHPNNVKFVEKDFDMLNDFFIVNEIEPHDFVFIYQYLAELYYFGDSISGKFTGDDDGCIDYFNSIIREKIDEIRKKFVMVE
jgi:hypothetical protein